MSNQRLKGKNQALENITIVWVFDEGKLVKIISS